jgi:hypothetical protein
MKLKMFVGPDTKEIERQVNVWRRDAPACAIIKADTSISYHMIPDLSGKDQLQQRITMTIWYDDDRGCPEPFPVVSPQSPRHPGQSN